MTITGKCDVCRKRKVKCDEQKPKCGACRKRDRICSYSYGKVTAFVAEDPVQLSKHGKSTGASIIQPALTPADDSSGSSTSPPASSDSTSPDELQMTTTRRANDDKGVFMTLAVLPSHAPMSIRKRTAQQRKKLQDHLLRLRESSELTIHRLASPESALRARFLEILGHRPLKDQPLTMLGSWVETIPSRIGTSPVVDLALEYFADSFSVFRGDTFSTRSIALASKARALKQLQLVVSDDQTRATYNTALAMKIHFVTEIFMGLKTLYHIIHTIALVEILREGPVADFDVDHYWNFLDNTYLDDVTEAMVSGRTTVFDNDFYLELSSPANVPRDAPAAFCLSVTMMHIFIQLPRLVCLVRHVIRHPDDTEIVSAAVRLAESLWLLDPFDVAEQILLSTTSSIPIPPAPEIADIVPDSLHFDSIDSCLLLSRYWLMELALCGLLENLVFHFPTETANSLLPSVAIVQRKDINAAIKLARCVHYAVNTCPSLPVLPLRTHTHVIWSTGSWRRLYQRTERALEALQAGFGLQEDVGLNAQLERAIRMEQFVTDEGNRLHVTWGIEPVSSMYIYAAVQSAVGNDIPPWMATSVKFEPEAGEMVMKVEYGLPGDRFEMMMGENDERVPFSRNSTTVSPFGKRRLNISSSPTPQDTASTTANQPDTIHKIAAGGVRADNPRLAKGYTVG